MIKDETNNNSETKSQRLNSTFQNFETHNKI